MISAIFLINQKGEIILYRLYRDDVSLAAANTFRLSVIAAKEAGSAAPVRNIDGSTFMYIRHKDMFFVTVTRGNSNVGAWPARRARRAARRARPRARARVRRASRPPPAARRRGSPARPPAPRRAAPRDPRSVRLPLSAHARGDLQRLL